MTPNHHYIAVQIPHNLEQLDEAKLLGVFNNKIYTDGELGGDLLGALDLELSNARAEPDDVEFDHVEFAGDEISVSYTVTWSAYYGCDNFNKIGQYHGTIFGNRVGDEWRFDLYTPPTPRTTLEEF